MRKLTHTRNTLALVAGLLSAGSIAGYTTNIALAPAWAETPHSGLKAEMILTEAENGKTVKTKVGEIFEIRLESNATTGYEWSIAVQNKAVLDALGDPHFIAPDSDKAGAPGQQAFLFKSKKAGGTKLELHYARPFEKGKPPIQTYTVHLDIG